MRRLEVFTHFGKGRDWPLQVKVSIVAERYSGKESVGAGVRRHGTAAFRLFTWRCLLRKEMEERAIGLALLRSIPSQVATFPDAGPFLDRCTAPDSPHLPIARGC